MDDISSFETNSNGEFEFSEIDDDVSGHLDEVRRDLEEAVLWGTDWTVETVLAQLARENIQLNPRFQRRDAWSMLHKCRFIESVLLHLPIPQLVLAEIPSSRGRYIVLDGKQRILALMQYAGAAAGSRRNGFRLTKLELLEELNGVKFKQMSESARYAEYYERLMSSTIRTVVIRNWKSMSFLHLIFSRLNTGSLKLSPQELRQSVAPGRFTDYLDDTTIESDGVRLVLGLREPDSRMRDVELLCRAVAFKLRYPEYRGRIKEFLDETCVFFNDQWDSQGDAVRATVQSFLIAAPKVIEVFGKKLARKSVTSPFNRSIFDAIIFYAMDAGVADRMLYRRTDVLRAFDEVLDNKEFAAAIESDTAGLPHTQARLRIWGEMLGQVLDIDVNIPILRLSTSA